MTFACRLDGGGWLACASPYPVQDLGLGLHTFEVRAIDAEGGADPSPASHSWEVRPTCGFDMATIYVDRDGVVRGGPSDGAAYGGTLAGTGGKDVLFGTEGAGTINAGGGNDVVCGMGGDDRINGEGGSDRLTGGAGPDSFSGGAGSDTNSYQNHSEILHSSSEE